MALSIFVPLGYIGFLVVGMVVFSRVYRRRTAQKLVADHTPWFPEGHPARDIYQTLVSADPAPPEVVLKAALLNRAMDDVRRIIRLRDDKQALGTLLQKGSIGDETMARFSLAEKELEAEILDVVSEANTFKEGWGQLIFPTASEMVSHLKHKEVYYDIQRQRAEEVKRLMDAGLPVPQPTVTLPPLVTPAGTTISIGQPGQGGPPTPQGGGPAPPNMQINAPGTSTPPPSTGLANGAPNGRGPQSRTARVEEEAEAEVEQVEALESKHPSRGSISGGGGGGGAHTAQSSSMSLSPEDAEYEDDDDAASNAGSVAPSVADSTASGSNRAARRRGKKKKGGRK